MRTYEIHCQRCGERIATFSMSDNVQLAMSQVRAHERVQHQPIIKE